MSFRHHNSCTFEYVSMFSICFLILESNPYHPRPILCAKYTFWSVLVQFWAKYLYEIYVKPILAYSPPLIRAAVLKVLIPHSSECFGFPQPCSTGQFANAEYWLKTTERVTIIKAPPQKYAENKIENMFFNIFQKNLLPLRITQHMQL